MQRVAGEELPHDLIRLGVGHVFARHGLVTVGVERLAGGIDAGDAVPGEHIERALQHQPHAVHQRLPVAATLGVLDGALEDVDDVGQVAGQVRRGLADRLGMVAVDPLLVVLELGALAQVQVAELLGLGALRLELDRDPLDGRSLGVDAGRAGILGIVC